MAEVPTPQPTRLSPRARCHTHATAEEVLMGTSWPDMGKIPIPNPNAFMAGGMNRSFTNWEYIIHTNGAKNAGQMLSWLKHGVDVRDFMTGFKGVFEGVSYDHPHPPERRFKNSRVCEGFRVFIAKTLEARVAAGSITVHGRVGRDTPPLLFTPLL